MQHYRVRCHSNGNNPHFKTSLQYIFQNDNVILMAVGNVLCWLLLCLVERMPVDFWRDVVQRVWWNIGNHKVPDGMASELIPLTPNEIQIVLKRYGVLHLAGILPWLLDSGDSGAFKFLNILNKFKELSEVSQKLLYVWKLMKESDDTGGNTGMYDLVSCISWVLVWPSNGVSCGKVFFRIPPRNK